MFVYLLFCSFEKGMQLSNERGKSRIARLELLVYIADISAEQADLNAPLPLKGILRIPLVLHNRVKTR